LKTLGDAIRLRNRMIELLSQANREPLAEARAAMLTFVVAGGGFSGPGCRAPRESRESD
jgi:NADH dehydrogenase